MTTTPTPADEKVPGLEVDRADIVIQRAIAQGWITVHDREEFRRNIRVGLDQEVRCGGPFRETPERAALAKSAPQEAQVTVGEIDRLCNRFHFIATMAKDYGVSLGSKPPGHPHTKHLWQDLCDAQSAFETAMRVTLAATPPREVATEDAIAAWSINLEKLLCQKLGIEWRPSGMSIVTLLEQLQPREVAAVEPPNFATRTICTADVMASIASISPTMLVSSVRDAIEKELTVWKQCGYGPLNVEDRMSALLDLRIRLASVLPESERHLLLGGQV